MKLKPGEFYGKTAQSLSAGGFRFTEKYYTSTARLPMHSHELSHFCFVLAGNYNERISSKHFDRSPAALVYYPPDVAHAEQHFTDGRHFLVEIDAVGLKRVTESGARLDTPSIVAGTSTLWLAARMYREFSDRDAFSPLALESICNELLIAASRQGSNPERRAPRWLGQVKEYLRENSAEPPTLTELASAINVHPTHLARVFRKFEGCTAGDYIRRVRIEKAQMRMISTSTPLVQIALETGFADQTHFTRSFKHATGMTPTEFRRVFKGR
jgi:AraC family transcriptional regulator